MFWHNTSGELAAQLAVRLGEYFIRFEGVLADTLDLFEAYGLGLALNGERDGDVAQGDDVM